MAIDSELSAGSRVISGRGGQARNLDRGDSKVKLLGNGHPRPLPPPIHDVVKFGVVRGRQVITLGSAQHQN